MANDGGTGGGGAGNTGGGGSGNTGGGQGGSGAGQAGAGGAGSAGGNAGAGAAGTGAAQDWTHGFSDDMKGYVANKGFKGPSDVLESYRNFEKLQGVPQNQLLRLPENLESPEARAVWERLGAPKEAKDYNIEIPKENGDQQLADWFKEVAFKNNMTKSQAENFVKAWNAKNADILKQRTDAAANAAKTAEANLKTEWGAAFDKNKNLVEQTAKIIGLTPEETQSLGQLLGPEKAPKLLLKLAQGVSESEFVGGGKSSGPMDPASATNRLNQLRNDPNFRARYAAGDKNAIAEMTQAFEQAYQGEQFLG